MTKIERKEIFDNFRNSGMNFDEQNIVITQNVEILAKKTTKLAREGVTSTYLPTVSMRFPKMNVYIGQKTKNVPDGVVNWTLKTVSLTVDP